MRKAVHYIDPNPKMVAGNETGEAKMMEADGKK